MDLVALHILGLLVFGMLISHPVTKVSLLAHVLGLLLDPLLKWHDRRVEYWKGEVMRLRQYQKEKKADGD